MFFCGRGLFFRPVCVVLSFGVAWHGLTISSIQNMEGSMMSEDDQELNESKKGTSMFRSFVFACLCVFAIEPAEMIHMIEATCSLLSVFH